MRTLTERLKALTEIDAVSGQEQPMVRHLLETLEHSCETVEVDTVGNV